ncbi:MAG: glycoside hydrolase, partial [Actinomycetota bacterium]|nr:glycoside hydrolase [Actinomycetota bacterium]
MPATASTRRPFARRPLARRPLARLRRFAVLVPAMLAAVQTFGAPATAGTVPAFHPGHLDGDTVVPSTPIPDFEGEPLVLQTTYIGRRAAEPTIGIDKQGNAFIAAYGPDSMGLVQTSRTRVVRSTDGGLTWQVAGPTLPTGDPMPPATLDPMIYVDEETGRVFNVELSLACSTVSFSDDRGASWISNPAGCGQLVNDHQTIVAANPTPGVVTVGYPNVVYYCFNRVTDSSCSRSLDGGLTWSPTGTPASIGYDPGNNWNKFGVPGLCGGLHGHVRADARGWLYIPRGYCDKPQLAVSENGGLTWRQTVVNEDISVSLGHVAEH